MIPSRVLALCSTKRTRTMERSTITQVQDDRMKYSTLRQAMRRTIEALRERGDLDEWTLGLLDEVRRSAWTEAAILAWTRCRWGELETLSLWRLRNGERTWITMTKVGEVRPGPAVPEPARDIWSHVPATTPLPYKSHATVCSAVKSALARTGICLPSRALTGTHAFRHIFATVRSAQGWTLDRIADALGHAETASTRQYIHSTETWRASGS